MNQLTIFCLVLGLISWYYFNKFQESEKEYNKLYKRFEQIYIENQKVKNRIKDLQSYKNDVSKTFKILDNELLLINDHLKKQNESTQSTQQRQPRQQQQQQEQPSIFRSLASMTMRNIGSLPINTSVWQLPIQNASLPIPNIPNENISLLTPELLTSLFNMNSEVVNSNFDDSTNQDTRENTDTVQTQENNDTIQNLEESIKQDILVEDSSLKMQAKNTQEKDFSKEKEIDNQLNRQFEHIDSNNYDRYLMKNEE